MPSTAAQVTPHDAIMSRSDENSSSDLENNESTSQTLGHKRSHDKVDKEDAATQAASEDLKRTTISTNSDGDPTEDMELTTTTTETQQPTAEKINSKTLKASTPEPAETSDARDAEMKEQVSSPKKKRSREQDDEARELEESIDDTEAPVTTVNGTATAGGRTTRLAPEKKRHRDTSADPAGDAETVTDTKESSLPSSTDKPTGVFVEVDETQKSPGVETKKIFGSVLIDKPQTSQGGYAKSTIAAFGSSADSPFAALAGQPSIFGSGTTTTSFGAPAVEKPLNADAPASNAFGGGIGAPKGFGDLSKPSPFGATAGGFGTNVFGNTGGFGFGSGSQKLSSFAAPVGKPDVLGEKKVKQFGAPESDEEEGSDEGDGEGQGDENSDDEEKAPAAEEKKKPKITKVEVESGEEGETTLLQFRAKIFTFDAQWKERGVGTLKLNVPKFAVDYGRDGLPILGTFDLSGRDEDDEESETGSTVSRLILRQESTHRVVLNTPILKALKFEEKPNAPAQILFTAIESGKPVQMLLKMNENNARLLLSEISTIQREL